MSRDATPDWVADAAKAAERKALSLVERAGGAFLHATNAGRYEAMPVEWWTSGFWPGMLLLLFKRTGDERLLALATAAEDEIARTIADDRLYSLDHDVGFQFFPTAVARYKLTGDPDARRRGFLAAALLMNRFNARGGFFEAWNGDGERGIMIVDTLMNLPLLFWAAEEFGQPRYRNAAEAHAELAGAWAVREDGSTNHIVRFNQQTGEQIEVLGGQGFAPDSRWTRGQAWALHGFALAHRHTGWPPYGMTAEQVADNFLAALPQDMIPPWDFDAPDAASAPRDSSAAAIAVSGLLELGRNARNEEYRRAGIDLLRALGERCFSGDDPDYDGLLRHATGELPLGKYIDVSLIYGDYFYLHALSVLDGSIESWW